MASLKIFQLWLVIVLAVLISAIGPVKSWPSGLGIGGQNFGPATKAQYGQYKLLRMATQGLGQKPWFLQFLSPRVDFWTSPIANGTVDVMVSPKYYRSVTNFLHSYQIPYKILMDDVQRAIDDQFKDVVDPDYENDVLKERVTVLQGGNIFSDWLQFFMRPFSNPDRPATSRQSWFPGLVRRPRKIQNNKFRKGHNMDWHSYHRLADITGYMYYLEHTYPDLCKVIEIGKSVEGRRTYILRIGSQKYSDKPAIVMEAGIHAREWISPATATYIMRELAENKNNADLIDFFDFYILPVANPDGYEYSFTSNRLWRKNRAKNRGVASLLLSLCDGVDLNRNFGYHWADALTPLHIQSGTQLNCMETYSGPGPYSEPETRNIREFVKSIQSNVVSYIPIHSYGQKILYPWSYTGVRLPDWQEMQNVGNILASAMERNSQGINYSVGSAPRTQYLAAGGSDDWARGEMGIKWVFLIELPDTGTFGFLLPATKIKGVGHSVFEGIRALASYLSLHSYGQKILYPWSYSAVRLHDWQEMQDVGRKIANTIEKNYSSDRIASGYAVGSSPRTQYRAAGGSDDFARGNVPLSGQPNVVLTEICHQRREMGIKWVYVFELPDKGAFGFLLPANKIKSVGRSIFEGIRTLAVHVGDWQVKHFTK